MRIAPSGILLVLFALLIQLPSRMACAQLVFSELIAVNTEGKYNPVIGEPGDWIEIYNGTEYAIDLSQYYLSDDPEDPFKWKFPRESILNYGQYHLVWADGTNDTLKGSHTNFKLSVTGESLFIHNAAGELYDSLSYPGMFENVSFGIAADGSRVYFGQPSPGSVNQSGTGFLVSGGVVFDPPPAVYPGPVEVHIAPGTGSGIIRYTLDGSVPDPDDPEYVSPIHITGNSVIRARLWQDGLEPGRTATSSYIIGEEFSFPVVSLASDPVHFWDDQWGIYVVGTNGRPGYCIDEPRNWNQPWERPISMEYFHTDGTRQIQHDGGTKIHGGCSRGFSMKSLAIFARSKYGNNRMNYPFFSMKDASSFKGLILRNSGNDFQYSFMRDAVVQAIVEPMMDVDDQAYEPVQVFLNGEYWGIHNLREKVNEHWVTSNYGIQAEDLDFIKNRREVFAGSYEGFNALYKFMEQNSLAGNANYNKVAEQIDMDSYMDYQITQMYFANRDWPGNNQKYWRDRVKGSKWRWILFDLDFCFGLYTQDPTFNMFTFSTADTSDRWPNPSWATLQFRRLLENDGFKEQFIRKYIMHLNTTLTPERINRVIDSCYHRLYDAFPAHIDRWNIPSSMEQWDSRVNMLRKFSLSRPAYVWSNMQEFFSLPPPVVLHIDPGKHGSLFANGTEVPETGVHGHYLPGYELYLQFKPEPGYLFKHWEISDVSVSDTILVPKNSSWKYEDTGIYPGDKWLEPGFDDTAWSLGEGELGYGDGEESTLLDYGGDSQNKHISYYFRMDLIINDPSHMDAYKIRLMRDDGAIVYINGVELVRDNMPEGMIDSTTTALETVGGGDESTYFEYPVTAHFFLPGKNIIAVEIHQQGPGSSDISFDLELRANILSPGETSIHETAALTLQPEAGVFVAAVTEMDLFEMETELLINEFMASNSGAHPDESGEYEDWIEIINAGEKAMDMAGLYFTDDLEDPEKWQIPAGRSDLTTVEPGEYLLFYADEDTLQGPMHLNFRLSSTGESIGLSARSGPSIIWIDSLSFGMQLSDISMGRDPDSSASWLAMEQFTPGYRNLVISGPTGPGTSNLFANTRVSLFPNPAVENIHYMIRPGQAWKTGDITLKLLDLTGRVITGMVIQDIGPSVTGSMDVTNLSGGVYLLIIEIGSERISRKIIIAR